MNTAHAERLRVEGPPRGLTHYEGPRTTAKRETARTHYERRTLLRYWLVRAARVQGASTHGRKPHLPSLHVTLTPLYSCTVGRFHSLSD